LKTSKNLILSLLAAALLFHDCEKASLDNFNNKAVNTDFLISKIFQNEKLFQEYIYNEHRKLIRNNFYYDDSIYYYILFEYDNEGILNKKNYSYDYFETFEHDESGRYIKLKSHNQDGEVKRTTEFIYNSTNQIEKGLITYSDFENTDTILYTYDSQGNVIKKQEGYMVMLEIEYDNKNNPRYNWDLPTDIVDTFRYEYLE